VRIGIAGLGLIGGSLALALKDSHDVRGFDIDASTRAAAGRARIKTVDRLDALLPADAVVIATPLSAVLTTMAALAQRGGPVFVDVTSVRGPVDAFAREHGDGMRIVGMHPMAGRSTRGFAAADPALLRDRPFLIVPTLRSDAAAMFLAGAIARDAGGIVTVCSAGEHDRIVAAVSALPLVLSAALAVVAADAVPGEVKSVAGTGYRDASRLALTPEELATQLLTANAAHVVAMLARLRTTLDEMERALAERDVAAIRELLGRARAAREQLE
jgi:prephenate dehydrogenase